MASLFFYFAVFFGSFLLFMIQPMIGKILLPCLGGSATVWTTCILFFQMTLLAGYLYAEKSIKLLGCEKQSVVHLLLLVLGFILLPIDVNVIGASNASYSPNLWLFAKLFASIGFLFFLISANAPLLQRWYANAGQKNSCDPYFLYAISNTGSLLALISYPFVIEPFVSLSQQKYLWSAAYIVQTLFVFGAAMVFWANTHKRVEFSKCATEKIGFQTILRWILYSFIPCSMTLAVTTHIVTDIGSGPMLWIFPLSVYLLSFVLSFAKTELFRRVNYNLLMLPMAVLVLFMYFYDLTRYAWFAIPLHLFFLFFVCMSFHAELAKDRPAVSLLNNYYVWLSVGGILGGIFNSILAPLVFKNQLDYVITLLVAVTFFTSTKFKHSLQRELLKREMSIVVGFLVILYLFSSFSESARTSLSSINGLAGIVFSIFIIFLFNIKPRIAKKMFLVAGILSVFSVLNSDRIVFVDRSFFGISKVTRISTDGKNVDADLKIEGVKDVFYCMGNGTTLHGIERKVDVRLPVPLSYYAREGPVGNIFRSALINRWAKKVAIVGLGCGTMAWYGRKWQDFDFFEIDPLVVKIATNPKYFTYLKNSHANCKIILGDARLNLEKASNNYYDLLVLDAYSSDSVPVHLLTIEALKIYLSKLHPEGLMILHLSNRYFKLGLVVAPALKKLGLYSIECRDNPANYSIKYDWYDQYQLKQSYWVVASKSKKQLNHLRHFGNWSEMKDSHNYSIWTDNYANLLQIYNWR